MDAADFSHSRQFPVKTEDGNLPGKYKVGSTAHGAASFLEITFLVFRVKAVWWLGDEYRGGDTFVLNLATQNTLSEYVTSSSFQQGCSKSLELDAICTCLFKALTSKADALHGSHPPHGRAQLSKSEKRFTAALEKRETDKPPFFPINGCCNLLPSPPKYSFGCYV